MLKQEWSFRKARLFEGMIVQFSGLDLAYNFLICKERKWTSGQLEYSLSEWVTTTFMAFKRNQIWVEYVEIDCTNTVPMIALTKLFLWSKTELVLS